MRLRAGRPADPSQGVDERAALDPEGAADRGFRRPAFERRDDGRHLFGVDRDRAAAPSAAAARCGKAGSNPLLGQRALELRQRPEDMKCFRRHRATALIARALLGEYSIASTVFSLCPLLCSEGPSVV